MSSMVKGCAAVVIALTMPSPAGAKAGIDKVADQLK